MSSLKSSLTQRFTESYFKWFQHFSQLAHLVEPFHLIGVLGKEKMKQKLWCKRWESESDKFNASITQAPQKRFAGAVNDNLSGQFFCILLGTEQPASQLAVLITWPLKLLHTIVARAKLRLLRVFFLVSNKARVMRVDNSLAQLLPQCTVHRRRVAARLFHHSPYVRGFLADAPVMEKLNVIHARCEMLSSLTVLMKTSRSSYFTISVLRIFLTVWHLVYVDRTMPMLVVYSTILPPSLSL